MPYAVITRDLEATAPYAEALAKLGFDTVAMPVTTSEAIECGLDRVLRGRQYDAIAIASARGARALVEAWNAPARTGARMVVSTWFEQMWGEPPDPPKPALDDQGRAKLPRIFVVGAATGKVLQEAGIACTVDPDAQDAESLAKVLIATLGDGEKQPVLRGKRFLAPRAAGGRVEMLDMLVYAGATIDAMSVYKTFHADPASPEIQEGRGALEEGGAEICCVFAPSQVTALAELVPINSIAATFVAIGDTTAKALRDVGAKRVVASDQPTPEGIAKAVRSVYPPKS
jgi:uroporphyrinogen-III synthase